MGVTFDQMMDAVDWTGVDIFQMKYPVMVTTGPVDDTVHGVQTWRCAARRLGTPKNNTQIMVSVEFIRNHRVCVCLPDELCGSVHSQTNELRDFLRAAVIWHQLHEQIIRLTERLGSGTKQPVGKTAIGQVEQRSRDFVQELEHALGRVNDPALRTYLHDTLHDVQERRTAFHAATRSGTFRDAVLAKIRKDVAGRNWVGPKPTFDSTRLLVGISPGRIQANQKLEGVVAALIVHTQADFMLLDAPMYAYEYLLRNLNGDLVMQAVPYPGNMTAATVAGIWSPGQDSPLNDLQRSVTAAQLMNH